MWRVSGTFKEVRFFGILVNPPNKGEDPMVHFHEPILVPSKASPADSILEHCFLVNLRTHHALVKFDERCGVYLGEFCLGWIIDRDDRYEVEPINHVWVNPTGKPGTVAEYSGYLEAFGFFNRSVPIEARSHLKVIGQVEEEKAMNRCRMIPIT